MHSIFEIIDEAPDSAGPDLVSLDDLKAALGITGFSEDAALEAAITFHSRIIAEYCNRRFGLADALETFTFDRYEVWPVRQALTLSLYPVVEVSEFTTLGAGGEYGFDPASGRLWSETCLQGEVSVVYSGGYDLPEQCPARLQMAVITSVNEGRISASRDPSIREVQHGDTRTSYFSAATTSASSGFLSATVMDLVKPYRRLHVA
jgi:hypothetical protein